jgi:predicted pyridoxine 5'-phosphate oxidase superfamily flavin-nucleotide-binding protein
MIDDTDSCLREVARQAAPSGRAGSPASIIPRMTAYHEHSRRLQDRFDTRRLADRLLERKVHVEIDADDRAFIERMDMFFLATADEQGRPQCSYKGGEPGFVRVLDERTIAFPSYDGNGMFLSLGNALGNPHVGLLFVDFERQRRLRLNGVASVDEADPLLREYDRAQLVVRVRATEVFPNCPRYVHRLELVERSRFVPRDGCDVPVPDWKRRSWSRDVLPAGDPAREAEPIRDG